MQPETRFKFRPNVFMPELEMYIEQYQYQQNNRTCLQLYYFDPELKTFFPYATLTVNIPAFKLSNPNCALLDTNNCPWSEELLVDALSCAEPTDRYARSGFCYYPEVELIPEQLEKLIYYKRGNVK